MLTTATKSIGTSFQFPSVFQLLDIEKRIKGDIDQNVLQLDLPLYEVNSPHRAAKRLFNPRGNEGEQDSLWFCFSICDLANKDGVLWVAYVSLFLHVGRGDCEHCAIVAESQRGNAGRVAVELTEALLVERVPDVHEAI